MNRVAEVVQHYVDAGDLVGGAVAVVLGEEMIWSGGFGVTDVATEAPVTVDTVFGVQSVTKVILATALMACCERGAFGLDDPVNRHLVPIRLKNEWEDDHPVTICQLLTHTAGLPNTSLPGPSVSLEEHVSGLQTTQPPGESIVYANSGYNVLGYLLGRLSASSWPEALDTFVLGPLAMSTSALGQPAEGAPVAVGHFLSQIDGRAHSVGSPPWEVAPFAPAGSLYSTVGDLARFLIAHLNEGRWADTRIASGATVSEMHRLQARAGRSPGGMGLGFRVDRRDARPFICHGGDSPGYTAFVGAYPDERAGVIVLLNTGRAQTARASIARAALEAVVPARQVIRHQPPVVPPTGGYRSTFWDFHAALDPTSSAANLTVVSGALLGSENTSALFPLAPEAGKSVEDHNRSSRWRADGGMFDGFELFFEADDQGERWHLYGGVYPLEFCSTADMPVGLPDVIDPARDLNGRWSGIMESPLGPLPLELSISATGARVTILTAADVALDDCQIHAGELVGRLQLDLPDFGHITVLLRLGANEERLQGFAFAGMDLGEFRMPTLLTQPELSSDDAGP